MSYTENYYSREGRHAFIAEKFEEYLSGRVLNIGGGGKKSLLRYVRPAEYVEMDIDGSPDFLLDLDRTHPLPMADGCFDAVLCTDVLEHLEHFHRVFQELLRISNRYVIISLPNPLRITTHYLRRQHYLPQGSSTLPGYCHGTYSKYYGLPLERPTDRHRWFYSYSEAEYFFRHHAKRGDYKILEEFPLGMKGGSLRGKLLRWMLGCYLDESMMKDLFASTYWCVIEKQQR